MTDPEEPRVERRPAATLVTNAIVGLGLALFVGATFAAVVAGGQVLLGTGEPSRGLMLAATALVAISFEPIRRSLRRMANRLVYGHRISPSEAVSRLAAELGDQADPTEVLASLARVIAAGTGADEVGIWLLADGSLVPMARSSCRPAPNRLALANGGLPSLPGGELTVPIRLGDELLGAITVAKPRSPLLPIEERLVRDLAAQVGIVTQTLRLSETLRHRLEIAGARQTDLVGTRARIVAAHDLERRRLERDIHDTCQQRAVVLAGKVGLAKALAISEPSRAGAILDEAVTDLHLLQQALDRVITGAFPTAPHGIGPALRVEAVDLPVAVKIADRTMRRYPGEMEATVFFCCMEAIQNAAKHAPGSSVLVRLWEEGSTLRFIVIDDGAGFDTEAVAAGNGLPNMHDRLGAVAGVLSVVSSHIGTQVRGELPLTPVGSSQ